MDDSCVCTQTSPDAAEAQSLGVTVRRAVASDRPAIGRFLQEAYGARARFKLDRWSWQFLENPSAHRDDDSLPVWIAVANDRVVGQIAVQMANLQVCGQMLQAGWAVDIMLLRSHRGIGLGHRLHDAVAGEVDVLLALTMADASRRLAHRQGCLTLRPVRQLTRWVRLDPATVRAYLLMHAANRPAAFTMVKVACNAFQLHRLVPLLVNPFLRVRDLPARSAPSRDGPVIAEVDFFGPEIDQLWQRTRSDYPVIVARDARSLNWRFTACPHGAYRSFVARRHGQAVGYVVLRHAEPLELRQGIVADLYASREDTDALLALVRHSIRFFGTDVAAIDCGTSVPEIESVLRAHGFFRTWTHFPTCVCRLPDLRGRLVNLTTDWFLSKADQDWDQIRPADPAVLRD